MSRVVICLQVHLMHLAQDDVEWFCNICSLHSCKRSDSFMTHEESKSVRQNERGISLEALASGCEGSERGDGGRGSPNPSDE